MPLPSQKRLEMDQVRTTLSKHDPGQPGAGPPGAGPGLSRARVACKPAIESDTVSRLLDDGIASLEMHHLVIEHQIISPARREFLTGRHPEYRALGSRG
jgi:hypothetical protein